MILYLFWMTDYFLMTVATDDELLPVDFSQLILKVILYLFWMTDTVCRGWTDFYFEELLPVDFSQLILSDTLFVLDD